MFALAERIQFTNSKSFQWTQRTDFQQQISCNLLKQCFLDVESCFSTCLSEQNRRKTVKNTKFEKIFKMPSKMFALAERIRFNDAKGFQWTQRTVFQQQIACDLLKQLFFRPRKLL